MLSMMGAVLLGELGLVERVHPKRTKLKRGRRRSRALGIGLSSRVPNKPVRATNERGQECVAAKELFGVFLAHSVALRLCG